MQDSATQTRRLLAAVIVEWLVFDKVEPDDGFFGGETANFEINHLGLNRSRWRIRRQGMGHIEDIDIKET